MLVMVIASLQQSGGAVALEGGARLATFARFAPVWHWTLGGGAVGCAGLLGVAACYRARLDTRRALCLPCQSNTADRLMSHVTLQPGGAGRVRGARAAHVARRRA
jgi:hypothetical protein